MQVHGSCHCGQIRFEAQVEPDRTSICHCTDCQKLSGSAFRVTVFANPGSFRLLSGQPSTYVKLADSGARRAQVFCPNCGSSLYVYDADNPTLYGLRTGCLDERAALVPRRQIWCRSAMTWTDDLSEIEKFQTTP